MWQSTSDGKDEQHSRGKVTWKKNHERRGHHARYQKRRQERENEAKARGPVKPNAPVAAGMVKGPPSTCCFCWIDSDWGDLCSFTCKLRISQPDSADAVSGCGSALLGVRVWGMHAHLRKHLRWFGLE
eukprot:s4099_g4.t1